MNKIIKPIPIIFGILILTSLSGMQFAEATINSDTISGWRNSQYGTSNQSDHNYWISVSQQMVNKFPGSSPGGVLVVGELDGQPGTTKETLLQFPNPGGSYPHVNFIGTDQIEPMLDAYDQYGLKVYLQPESAHAEIPMLMDLIMDRYKHHPSVIGFGVDAEWYFEADYPGYGKALSTAEVNAWATQVKTYNPNYKLMVKHWDYDQLSNARPSNVLFLTDTEQLGSQNSAVNEYIDWIDHFNGAEIGFQYAYPSDQSWWGNFNDPATQIIQPVLDARPNANIGALFLVDFSVENILSEQNIGSPCAPNCDYDNPPPPTPPSDTTKPTITPMGASKSIPFGSTYTELGATVTDNDPAYSGSVSIGGSVNPSVAGTYVVTYSAPADAAGNVPNEKSITITVQEDSTPNPAILNPIAGWRSSQYGNYLPTGHDQSDPVYWISVAQQMTAKFPGFTPGGVLVIGEIDGAPGSATSTFLPFPKPAGSYPKVNFGTTDKIEPLLDAYDSAGLKVYLQVESADADIPMLMNLIMNKYKHHPSVIGFGVDAEWYHEAQYPGWGRPLTSSEVNAWAAQVKTFDPDYDLLVKHWDSSYLSSARPDNVLFLTDSENIGSLSNTINEYVAWIDHFGNAPVGFQIGYPSDQSWWSNLNDPAAEIMNPVLAARPNANIGAIFWVDFSALAAFPDTLPPTPPSDTTKPTITPMGASKSIPFGSTYTELGATVTDNDPAYSGSVSIGGSVNPSVAGTYVVTYSAPADAAGNVPNEKSITITVQEDSTPSTGPVLFSDDFESGFAKWTESGEGDWELESPSEAQVPGNPSNLVAHSDNCDSTCTITMSDSIDLSSYSSANLSFWRYVDNDMDNGEYLKVELYDGTSWNTLFTWTNGSGDDDTWHQETVDLSGYLGASDFNLRFVTHESFWTEDAEIDDVLIDTTSLPPTPPSDTTKPTITPMGASKSIPFGSTYTELGATVTDNDPAYSGSVSIGGSVNPSVAGTYVVTYSAPADAAGNVPNEKSITITVQEDSTPSTGPVLFSDDFESGFAKWTESGEGDWKLESPSEVQVPGHSSNLVAHSDNCDSTCTITMSDSIDLSSYSSANLSFWRFVDNSLDNGEYLKVELYDGTKWNTISNWTHGTGDDNTWHQENVNLDSYLDATNFNLRFVTHESSGREEVEIDDVLIDTTSLPPTPPSDTTKPTITPMGASKSIPFGSTYTELGATVTDNDPAYSGSVSIGGSVNPSVAGTYVVTYSAPADAAGNVPNEKSITITVQEDSTPNPAILNPIAGWRSSQYGNYLPTGHDQSDPVYWISVAQQMTAKFPGFTPGGVLVIGEIDGAPGSATSTFLPFPKPAGSYPKVNFGTTDKIEPLLDAYDSAGLKVYLQVESADADIPMLMNLIMNKYKHHPSVIGFGVDAEWYHEAQYPGWGRPLTSSEVNAWAAQVKTFDPDYDLLVKHWDSSYLSSARPDNVLFLTDSENIGSLSNTINEYVAWIDHFGNAPVGFQIGYPSDQSWWSNLNDPAAEIMNPVLAARPNANIGAIFWVDFSALAAFPDTLPPTPPSDTTKPTITPMGASKSIPFGSTYTELGATVTDNDPAYSGSVSIGGSVNPSVAGTYVVTYSAPADAAGNVPNEKSITITVQEDSTPSTGPVLFSDDFESGFAKWTESGEGDWELESPSEAQVPGNPSNLVAHSDNCDSTCTITMSDSIDLSSYSSANLSFWRYVDNDMDNGEYLKVELYDGTSWNTLFTWTNGSGDDDTWHQETVDLSGYLGASDFNLRFVTHESFWTEDAEIDDVLIEGQ